MAEGRSADVAVLPPMAAFQQAVGTTFSVRGAAPDQVVLTLTDVNTFDRPAGWESFTLLFSGSGPPLSQGTYGIEQTGLGKIELFLVPVQSDDDGQWYEAVFNRRAP